MGGLVAVLLEKKNDVGRFGYECDLNNINGF